MKIWLDLFKHRAAAFFLEEVHSMPGQGVASCFTFGSSFGFLHCLGLGCGRFERVRPQIWQRDLNCRTGGDKNISKARAMELFPSMRVTHANADALLIAEYGRRKAVSWGLLEAPKPVYSPRRTVPTTG
jgi:hypothetical protein